jgi:hypothetical protein
VTQVTGLLRFRGFPWVLVRIGSPGRSRYFPDRRGQFEDRLFPVTENRFLGALCLLVGYALYGRYRPVNR